MREYHIWFRKATIKTSIPHLVKRPHRYTLTNHPSAKLKTSFLQAAIHYVNNYILRRAKLAPRRAERERARVGTSEKGLAWR